MTPANVLFWALMLGLAATFLTRWLQATRRSSAWQQRLCELCDRTATPQPITFAGGPIWLCPTHRAEAGRWTDNRVYDQEAGS